MSGASRLTDIVNPGVPPVVVSTAGAAATVPMGKRGCLDSSQQNRNARQRRYSP